MGKMTEINRLQKEYELLNLELELRKTRATSNLLDFTRYTMPNYQVNWHHRLILYKLNEFAHGRIKKLILSVPPQHGKSEIASRRLPAFIFGLNPDKRIAGCSYNDTFAAKFNRQVQRIVDSEKYREVFPNTNLNSKNVATSSRGAHLRNAHEFEIVGHNGSYISVGVGGGITGNPVDILIIDDPIKGRKDANSKTIRESLWEWYTDDACSRLHNDSQQLIINTRWHEDDLTGRVIASEGDEWEVVNIPAILLSEIDRCEGDERNIGDVLWPEKHSLERMMKIKEKRPRTFSSLYQGKPSPDEGGIIKKDWFIILKKSQWPSIAPDYILIDGAYTKNTANDPTGMLAGFKHGNDLYVCAFITRHMEMPALRDFVPLFAEAVGFDHGGSMLIEPKASGSSLKQLLKENGYNAIEIGVNNKKESKFVADGKEARANAMSPYMEAGRVFLLEGAWNTPFLEELAMFPNATHDEAVDCLCYIIHRLLSRERKARVG